MSEPKMCCNCLHCARWKRKDGIETHCDLNDKYLGYLQVMDEDNDCKHWEKETKWDEQRKHDEEIRADIVSELKDRLIKADGLGRKGLESVLTILEQMNEQKNVQM